MEANCSMGDHPMNRRKLLTSIGAGGLVALGVAGSASAETAEAVETAGESPSRVKLQDGRVLETSTDDDCDCIIEDCSYGCPPCCDYCLC